MKRMFVFLSGNNGVTLHRLILPYNFMAKHSDPSELDIKFFVYTGQSNDEIVEAIKDYDDFVFNRTLPDGLIEAVAATGIKIICDNDDYWVLDKNHPLYYNYQARGTTAKIMKHLQLADIVTTTTELLANEIRKINPNVYIIPNALSAGDEFTERHTQSARIRFGIVGSASHTDDMKLLKDITHYLPDDILKKIQFVLCGFSGGTVTTVDEEGKIQKVEKADWKDVCWTDWEKQLTNNYATISKQYADFLKMYVKDDDRYLQDEPYRRIWTKDVFSYARVFEEMDVLLVPLMNNKFNTMKSPLKLVEASVKGLAVICSDVEPYSQYLNESNSIAVDVSRGARGFAKAIIKFAKHPELIKQTASELKKLTAEGGIFNNDKVAKETLLWMTKLL